MLGAGGFGITYEAISPFIGRRWAIKEFFPQGFASRDGCHARRLFRRDGDIIERALDQFERSTEKLCELDHPNILKVFHYIEANATGYMVMDYVEGPTFELWLRDARSRRRSAICVRSSTRYSTRSNTRIRATPCIATSLPTTSSSARAAIRS